MTGTDILARFRAADAKIFQSIADGNRAREARDAARSQRARDKAERAMYAAQDAHTAAWAERHAVSADYRAEFARQYGRPAHEVLA